jgi:hypothetical protein
MHEFDTPTVPAEVKLVLGTQWSKNITASAKSSSLDRYEFITEYKKTDARDVL